MTEKLKYSNITNNISFKRFSVVKIHLLVFNNYGMSKLICIMENMKFLSIQFSL